jgi:hypothetical protein
MPRHVYHRNIIAYPTDDSRQVQGLLIGVVAAFVIFITIIGPEYAPFVSLVCVLFQRPTFSLFSETMAHISRITRLPLKRVLLVTMP